MALYRAIDQFGQVIDVFVSACRDAKAAHRFFLQALGTTRAAPSEVVSDRSPTYPVVLEELRQRRGIALSGMPTTTSRPITDASSPGCGRCGASSETAAPG
jgi:transposase-like protein